MIKNLTLKNFQCHQKLKLDLGTITTIVGPTDAGKSSVLRALRWLCLNDFGGDEFIRDGSKEAQVQIQVGKKIISRSKSKSSNVYEFNDHTFKSFGQKVPDPIAAKLRLDPINFQGQHDTPYWFTASAGEVSRELNRIIDLSVIDSTLASVASRLRDAQGRKQILRERIDALQGQADAKNRQMVADFDLLLRKRKTLAAIQDQKEVLSGMIMHIASIDVPSLLKRAADVKELLGRSVDLFRLERKALELEKLIADCSKWEKTKMPPEFKRIWEKYELTRDIQIRIFTLRKMWGEADRLQTKVWETDDRAKWLSEEIEAIAETTRTCPTCGRPL